MTENEILIKEFIEETADWCNEIEHLMGMKQCPTCGIIPAKVRQLVLAVIELKEKNK